MCVFWCEERGVSVNGPHKDEKIRKYNLMIGALCSLPCLSWPLLRFQFSG